MDFGKILSRAWNIIWTHKVLWLFGILASCGARSGGGGGAGGSNVQGGPQDFHLPPEMERIFTNLERTVNSIPPERLVLFGLLFFAAILLLVLISWLVGLFGKTGLTVGALRAEAGSQVAFRPIASEAWGHFDRVVALNFVLSLIPFFATVLIVGAGVLLGIATFGVGLLCLVPLVCLLVPLFIAYSVYTDIANVAVVKERLGVGAAIGRAWEVFRSNLGNIAVLALILIVGGFIVNLLLALPFFIALLPLLINLAQGGSNLAQNLGLYMACIVVSIPFIIVFSGIVQSYLQTAWTLAYNQITAAPTAAAPVRKTRPPAKRV